DTAHATAWLDVALDVQLAEAVWEVVGHERARQLNRAVAEALIGGPLLRPLHSAAMKVLGSNLAAFKWLPSGWRAVFRDVGRPEWVAADRALVLAELPPVAWSQPWIEGVASAIEGLAVLSGAGPEIRAAVDLDPRQRRVRVVLRG